MSSPVFGDKSFFACQQKMRSTNAGASASGKPQSNCHADHKAEQKGYCQLAAISQWSLIRFTANDWCFSVCLLSLCPTEVKISSHTALISAVCLIRTALKPEELDGLSILLPRAAIQTGQSGSRTTAESGPAFSCPPSWTATSQARHGRVRSWSGVSWPEQRLVDAKKESSSIEKELDTHDGSPRCAHLQRRMRSWIRTARCCKLLLHDIVFAPWNGVSEN